MVYISQVNSNFVMTHTALKEALRGNHFSLALKLVVTQNTFELALDGGMNIRSANSRFVLSNHN